MKPAAPSPLRFAIGGVVAMAVAMGIGRFVYTPILPGMMEELHLSAAGAGWIASANYLGYLLGALAAAGGWAHGRERAIMLAGLAASAVLAGLMGLTGWMPAFLAIRFLAGIASAFVMVFLSSIVMSHMAVAGRPGLQTAHFAGVGLGIALSSALMAILVTHHADWRAGWFWSAAISALGFVPVALLIDRGPAVHVDHGGEPGREPALAWTAPLVKVTAGYGLFGIGYVVTATFLIAIVRQGGGGRVFEAMVWLATGISVLPSLWLWQKVARRAGLYGAYLAACLVEAVGVAASVSMGGTAGPLLGGVLLGLTFIAATALGLQAGRLLAPRSPRRVLALMTASFGVGQILGPIAAGMLAERSGSFFLPSLAAAIVLLASGLVVWSAKRGA
ncbi:YbfB/YjiJ family MFS transporter [Mesorhizobium sp. SP-1A]|uniref:YbfB/YjiJ family MFS transporter n=1 Tax=Mesorhizobium sp. SP-1A TaxID=3077840 RepID=UPI0028F74397|nr:YbfB/YjiJ family MFS transporter [Mesorhizobium sp. SP-1A]